VNGRAVPPRDLAARQTVVLELRDGSRLAGSIRSIRDNMIRLRMLRLYDQVWQVPLDSVKRAVLR
jgi:hypothetical protein